MEQNKVIISNLALHQEFVAEIANWVYREFATNVPGRTLEVVIERLKNRCFDRVPFSLIAIIDNKCVGICSVFENDLKVMERTPWLAGLYVDNDFRGEGIAQSLIEEILSTCRSMGYNKIFLRTEKAAEYYRKRGWTFMEDTVDEYGVETSVFYREI